MRDQNRNNLKTLLLWLKNQPPHICHPLIPWSTVTMAAPHNPRSTTIILPSRRLLTTAKHHPSSLCLAGNHGHQRHLHHVHRPNTIVFFASLFLAVFRPTATTVISIFDQHPNTTTPRWCSFADFAAPTTILPRRQSWQPHHPCSPSSANHHVNHHLTFIAAPAPSGQPITIGCHFIGRSRVSPSSSLMNDTQ
jgi:hypothetical protein